MQDKTPTKTLAITISIEQYSQLIELMRVYHKNIDEMIELCIFDAWIETQEIEEE